MIPKGQKVVVTPWLPRIGAVVFIASGLLYGYQAWHTHQSHQLARELGYATGGLPWWVSAVLSLVYLGLGVTFWLRRNTPPPGWQYGDDADQD